MKINDLMLRDIRAKIDFEDDLIIIKNTNGEVKKELLSFFNEQLNKNMDNMAKKKGRKKKIANESEIMILLINKLTNIEIDIDDLNEALLNPSYELSMTLLYLSSIMQELIFEVLATQNLKMRMEQNTILEKDTLDRVHDIENLVKEISQMKAIDS